MEFFSQVEEVFDIAGRYHKYQYIMLTIFFFFFGNVEFFITSLHFLEAKPKVSIANHNQTIVTTINYTICETIPYEVEHLLSPKSIVYDFEIYCNQTATSLIAISHFAGIAVGAMITYLIADRIGRRLTLMILDLVYLLCLSTVYLVKSLIFLYCHLFVWGIATSIMVVTLMVYICEIINKKKIAISIMVIVSSSCINGEVYMVLFYWISDWKKISLIIAAINLGLLLLIFTFMNESPLFCMTNGNIVQLIQSLKAIGRFNGRMISNKDLENVETAYTLQCIEENITPSPFEISSSNHEEQEYMTESLILRPESQSENELLSNNNSNSNNHKQIINRGSISTKGNEIETQNENVDVIFNEESDKSIVISISKDQAIQILKNSNSFKSTFKGKEAEFKTIQDYTPIDLIRYKSQKKSFFILCFLWLSSSFVFQGLNINNKNMPQDSYITVFVSLLIEVISFYSVFFISIKIGRLRTCISLQLISFVLFMICILSNQLEDSILFSICLFISLICWECLGAQVYIIACQIYPTVLRSKGLGYNSAIGKIGAICAPFIIEKMDLYTNIVILCAISFFGVVFSFVLPETFSEKVAIQVPEESSAKNKKSENTI